MAAVLFCIGLVAFVGLCCWLGSERQFAPPWESYRQYGSGG